MSKLYKCQDCKQLFEENEIVERVYYQFHDEVDTERYESVTCYQCPYCLGINIEEMDEYEGEL